MPANLQVRSFIVSVFHHLHDLPLQDPEPLKGSHYLPVVKEEACQGNQEHHDENLVLERLAGSPVDNYLVCSKGFER